MLGYMREQRRSIVIYVFFSLIIVTFVLSFGPGSGSSCAGTAQVAARVNGEAIPSVEFELSLARYRELLKDQKDSKQIRETIMTGLIRERLVAQAAEAVGFRASDAEVVENIEKRPEFQTKKSKEFSVERYKQIVNWGYRTSIAKFEEGVKRQLVAQKAEKLVRDSLWVSEGELWSDYEDKNRVANVEYVEFDAKDYEKRMTISDAEKEKWKSEKKKEIENAYAKRKADYREYSVRQIVIVYGEDATKEERRKRAEEARVAAKGGDFAAVAKKESEDLVTKEAGGALGWLAAAALPTDAMRTEVQVLKDGEVSRVIDEPGRFIIVKREASRDKALKDVEGEIAGALMREAGAATKAKSDAEALIAKAKADGKRSLRVALGEKEKPAKKDGAEGATDDADKSRVKESGEFGWNAQARVQGIGVSKPLMKAVFKTLTPGQPVYGAPVEVDGKVYVVRLVKRDEPLRARFDEELKRKDMRKERLMTKAWEASDAWQDAVRVRAKIERNVVLLAPERAATPEKPEDGAAAGIGEGAPAPRDSARR